MPQFALQFPQQLFLSGQVQLVAAGVDVALLLFAQRVLHDRIVLVWAQHQADGWVVAIGAAFAVLAVHVELHLPQVGVRQLAYLQIHQHVALQHRVLEKEVDVEVVAHQACHGLASGGQTASLRPAAKVPALATLV